MKRKILIFGIIVSLLPNFVSSKELIVSAAASLTDVFNSLIDKFQQDNSEIEVVLNLGGSGALLQQIYKGAPVDVYASANMVLVREAVARQALREKSIKLFASNDLVMIVQRGQNKESPLIKSVADITDPSIKRIAVSNYGVPVGRYTMDILKHLGFWDEIFGRVINTMNVRQTLSYVLRGEVDVGFVYFTDALTQIEEVEIIAKIDTVDAITYPIAVTQRTKNCNVTQSLRSDSIIPIKN